MLGLREKSRDRDVRAEVMPLNGRTGIAFVLNGALQSVFRFEIEDGKISRIYATLNPDKLKQVGQVIAEGKG